MDPVASRRVLFMMLFSTGSLLPIKSLARPEVAAAVRAIAGADDWSQLGFTPATDQAIDVGDLLDANGRSLVRGCTTAAPEIDPMLGSSLEVRARVGVFTPLVGVAAGYGRLDAMREVEQESIAVSEAEQLTPGCAKYIWTHDMTGSLLVTDVIRAVVTSQQCGSIGVDGQFVPARGELSKACRRESTAPVVVAFRGMAPSQLASGAEVLVPYPMGDCANGDENGDRVHCGFKDTPWSYARSSVLCVDCDPRRYSITRSSGNVAFACTNVGVIGDRAVPILSDHGRDCFPKAWIAPNQLPVELAEGDLVLYEGGSPLFDGSGYFRLARFVGTGGTAGTALISVAGVQAEVPEHTLRQAPIEVPLDLMGWMEVKEEPE